MMRERVQSGQSLSEAFEAQGAGVVCKIYTTTLLAGERSGNLEEVLSRYISYQRITSTFRKKLVSSLWYPALLFVALTVMPSFLFTYVVPKFAALYAWFGAAVPVITKRLSTIRAPIHGYLY